MVCPSEGYFKYKVLTIFLNACTDAFSILQCFGRAVTVCPNEGYSKYMNLGQLFEGSQAVECFQKGIELMMKEKEKKESEEVP